MFFPQAPGSAAPPAAAVFDFALPDALLRAREAALAALDTRRTLQARGRGLTLSQTQLLSVLVVAGAPLTQTALQRRSGYTKRTVQIQVRRLIDMGYLEWAPPAGRGRGGARRRVAARDIGRRALAHAARETERAVGLTWDTLAARPAAARFDAPMRRRLFGLLAKLRRAAERAAVLEGMNEPDQAGYDLLIGLPGQLRLARRTLLARVKKPLAKYHFSEAQWRVLRILAGHAGIGWTLTGLVRRGCFHANAPIVHSALLALSQRGLVRRHGAGERPARGHRAPKRPRRRWRAAISRDGLAIVGMVEERARRDNADLFHRLGADEMTELQRLLGRLTRALLWRDGAADEDQETHPFGPHYDRFDAAAAAATRAYAVRRRLLRAAGLALPRRGQTPWHI